MKLQASILGIVTVVCLAAPGFAQQTPQQPNVTPLTLQSSSVKAKKWEYHIGRFSYKPGKSNIWGNSTKGDWIFELDGSKQVSLRDGLAEMGSMGYELVGIDPSSGSGHSDSLYIRTYALTKVT